jgi:hypothetical protein
MQIDIPEVLPNVLGAYLRETLNEIPGVGRITLMPSQLGWGMVQTIVIDSRNDSERRTVFGFRPVKAVMEVCPRQTGFELELLSFEYC